MLSGEERSRLEKEIRSRLKTVFGKGPEQIEISFFEKAIVVAIRGFLTKVERLRMEETGGMDGIRDFRYIEMKKEMEGILKGEAFSDIVLDNVYMDVHVNEDRACFVAFAK